MSIFKLVKNIALSCLMGLCFRALSSDLVLNRTITRTLNEILCLGHVQDITSMIRTSTNQCKEHPEIYKACVKQTVPMLMLLGQVLKADRENYIPKDLCWAIADTYVMVQGIMTVCSQAQGQPGPIPSEKNAESPYYKLGQNITNAVIKDITNAVIKALKSPITNSNDDTALESSQANNNSGINESSTIISEPQDTLNKEPESNLPRIKIDFVDRPNGSSNHQKMKVLIRPSRFGCLIPSEQELLKTRSMLLGTHNQYGHPYEH